jgi:DEAD/DEAH box helicase domain-containing protein
MSDLMAEQCQTITFARSRVAAELICKYLRESLAKRHPELAARVRSYRGGYLPSERRDIELVCSGDKSVLEDYDTLAGPAPVTPR